MRIVEYRWKGLLGGGIEVNGQRKWDEDPDRDYYAVTMIV